MASSELLCARCQRPLIGRSLEDLRGRLPGSCSGCGRSIAGHTGAAALESVKQSQERSRIAMAAAAESLQEWIDGGGADAWGVE